MTKTSAAERRRRQSKRKAEDVSLSPAAAAAGFDRSQEEMEEEFFQGGGEPRALERTVTSVSPIKKRIAVKRKEENVEEDGDCCFVGDPVPQEEAKRRWPERYKRTNGAKAASITDKENNDTVKARRHFLQARVDDCIYNLYDSAYVQADGEPNYIGRILEFFETCDHQLYFTAQWFFRAQDTVIKEHAISCDAESHYHVHDAKRVFLSEDKDDNALSCIVTKVQIVRVAPNIDLCAKEKSIPICDLYYDMTYSVQYSTFANLPSECEKLSIPDSSNSTGLSHMTDLDCETSSSCQRSQLSLLDLYSGCGGMSTGLCLGANISGVNLQTRWAVDLNPHACESLRFNHPETEVRNEEAQDFLDVLREWEKLCLNFGLGNENTLSKTESLDTEEEDDQLPGDVVSEEFEVERIVDICYGKTSNLQKPGLKFKVRWKGYGPNDDTWEPADGLSKCQERIEEFVRHGYRKKILPLPGTIDVICGGPPCQGISGFNLYRNSKAPLDDVKNKQMVVFMEIIDFLKPRFVLMENVVDILKFAEGFLGRYALSRLVAMNYQSRLGIVVAGCYGLPQFRMRVFLWGALPSEKLPQFPLPTHDVVVRGGCPVEFECCSVAYKQNQHRELKKALLLSDAISDLPPVANNELRDEMDYVGAPVTDFQRFIRRSREELMNLSFPGESSSQKRNLFDHRPFKLKEDDYIRVCRIPKRKGANFRDLPGVIVGPDKKAMLDPQVEREYLASGKPLVPNYAISFTKGKSLQPFGRLWWDEIVPTVVTRPEPHNRTILHPEQDRVLTIRENARLQGFPDYYKLFGPIRERYIQVGNAVAVPVSRALGYALGQALQGKCNEKPLFSLPPDFPTK